MTLTIKVQLFCVYHMNCNFPQKWTVSEYRRLFPGKSVFIFLLSYFCTLFFKNWHSTTFFESLIPHKQWVELQYGKRQKSCTLIVILVKCLYLTSPIFNSPSNQTVLFIISRKHDYTTIQNDNSVDTARFWHTDDSRKKGQIPLRVSLKDFSYPLRVAHTTPHVVFLPLTGADVYSPNR